MSQIAANTTGSEKGMVELMKKMEVITEKLKGSSNRAVSRQTGLDRETVSKYWEDYKQKRHELQQQGVDERQIQEELTRAPKYDSSNRTKRKYTEEIEVRLKELLQLEKQKDSSLGSGHKQSMTNKQIFDILQKEGYDIGRSTINNALTVLRSSERKKEVFIRQQHDFGDRVEYDFGEVRLIIGGILGTYHMAVFASPAGKFRWCKLYTNQKKPVFMDSHVKFLDFIGGCYREIVYDNMKNVVSKFIGKNEKQLNEDLVKMSIYYGFSINVTNCFSGNEKGSVEKAIDVLRTELFAVNYRFNTLDDVEEYVKSKLLKLNEDSLIAEEKAHLLPHLPSLELADITTAKADKSSLISVDTVMYSVPEELTGQTVIVKKYHDEIRVFFDNTEVCRHRRKKGKDKFSIEVMHYLETFKRKPGAVSNSVALKSIPKLKAIFDTHYTKKPREFIETLTKFKHLSIDEVVDIFKEKTANKAEFNAICVVKPIGQVDMRSRSAMANYTMLVKGGAGQ